MTLVVMVQNNDWAAQVSDRRLTRGDGTLFDDESNKAILYQSASCKLIFGFSGLAECGSFRLRDWLPTALRDMSPPEYTPDAMLPRLTKSLGDSFAKDVRLRNVTPAIKRLTIMFNGFLNTNVGALISYGFITNYQDYDRFEDEAEAWPQFRLYWRTLNPIDHKQWAVQRIGMWSLFGHQEIESVKPMLVDGTPVDGVIDKCIEVFRELADNPIAGGVVGKQLMSANITADFSEGGRFAYHTDVPKWTYYTPTFVVAAPGSSVIFSDGHLSTSLDAPPIVVPKQRRNEQCRCGSGKKYKLCHGR